MPNKKELPRNMLEDILARPSDKEMIERGLLPESCAFHLETALTFARMLYRRLYVKDDDAATEESRVVIEQLEEIKKKVEAAKNDPS